jgi:hypothetical protein
LKLVVLMRAKIVSGMRHYYIDRIVRIPLRCHPRSKLCCGSYEQLAGDSSG